MTDLGIEVAERPRPQPFVYRYRMKGWYDGDSPTVWTDHGRHLWKGEDKLRLYGIDTPELRGIERSDGIAVRDIVRLWAPPGSEGDMASHEQGDGKYGRLLVTMWPDGWGDLSINERLFREGLAEIKTYDRRTDAILEKLWREVS